LKKRLKKYKRVVRIRKRKVKMVKLKNLYLLGTARYMTRSF